MNTFFKRTHAVASWFACFLAATAAAEPFREPSDNQPETVPLLAPSEALS